jgi:general secretion pathway protein A
MYEAFYGLSAPPFQLSPDHRFFFESAAHRSALAHVVYGLEQGEGFIVITGEVGAGKTTLVGHLFAQLDRQRFVAGRIVSTQLSGDDMLRMVAAAFGIAADAGDKATLLQRVEHFLLATQNDGRRCVLVVDEAQNLSIAALEELRMLSNFQSGAQAPLQSFLLGQPQFRSVLAAPALEQLRQRVIAAYHLGPLAGSEIRAYVEHRLRAVGWRDDPAITEPAFAALRAATDGIPRRVNTLCARLLLFGSLEGLHRLDETHVARVAAELRAELAPPSCQGPTSAPTVAPASPTAPTMVFDTAPLLARLVALETGMARQAQALALQDRLLRTALGAATALLELEAE